MSLQSPNQTTNLILEHIKNNYNLNIVHLNDELNIIPTICSPFSNEVGFDCKTKSLFLKKDAQINVSLITFHAVLAIHYDYNDDATISDYYDNLKLELRIVDSIGLLAEWISEFRASMTYIDCRIISELNDDEVSDLVECFLS